MYQIANKKKCKDLVPARKYKTIGLIRRLGKLETQNLIKQRKKKTPSKSTSYFVMGQSEAKTVEGDCIYPTIPSLHPIELANQRVCSTPITLNDLSTIKEGKTEMIKTEHDKQMKIKKPQHLQIS